MNTITARLLVVTLLMSSAMSARGAEPPDACFRDLPLGCFITESFVVPRDQTMASGRRALVEPAGHDGRLVSRRRDGRKH